MSETIQRKLFGKQLAAEANSETLEFARVHARVIAEPGNRAITIENLRTHYEIWGIAWTLGNAAGSVFDGDEWEAVGVTTAKRPEAHGRLIRQWRLRK